MGLWRLFLQGLPQARPTTARADRTRLQPGGAHRVASRHTHRDMGGEVTRAPIHHHREEQGEFGEAKGGDFKVEPRTVYNQSEFTRTAEKYGQTQRQYGGVGALVRAVWSTQQYEL